LVALDFETTGLDLRRDSVVSFGAAPVDGGRVVLGSSVYLEVAPTSPLSHESITIHHLRPIDLDGAEGLDDARAALAAALDGRYLLVWVAEIETHFLARLFHTRRARWTRRAVDVARLHLAFDRLSRDAVRPRLPSLSEAAARHGVPVEDAHHALDDAVMTAELFIVLATKLEAFGYRTLRSYLHGGRSRWGFG
jgi:DNA polymerase-3 subunit epsilon